MLDKLGHARVPLDVFHLLFSGGKIGGDQIVDVEAARRIRRAIPMLSLFGGGLGNQILPGKVRISNAYPICEEARRMLPRKYRDRAESLSYRAMTFEKSFSRKDDSKNELLVPHIADSDLPKLTGEGRKGDGEVAQQMRMTCELVAAGAMLYTEIEALDVTDIELGCLVSGLHRFAVSPHIGGQAQRGHGRVALHYELIDLDSGETKDFLRIDHGPAELAPPAEQAKQSYDIFLRETYDAMLASQQTEIRQLLGAA
ncbi:MAG TPA: hypothetical protein VNL74_00960 [Methylococcus sp.]|nr:hypothetical protein [Methylococcus sp.]